MGQTTDVLTTLPIGRVSASDSEHTDVLSSAKSILDVQHTDVLSSAKSTLNVQQDHYGQIDKPQRAEEVTALRDQSDEGVGDNGKLPDPYMKQCTLDNPPPMQFVHVATTGGGGGGDKPTQTGSLPVALQGTVMSLLLSQLKSTSGHDTLGVTLAPNSVVPTPLPRGPSGVVPTLVAVAGGETQGPQEVEMNNEPCCMPVVENIESTIGDDGAGVFTSFSQVMSASKSELGTDSDEPVSATHPPSNTTQVLAAPETLTR